MGIPLRTSTPCTIPAGLLDMPFTESTNCQMSLQHTLEKVNRVARGQDKISQRNCRIGPRYGSKNKEEIGVGKLGTPPLFEHDPEHCESSQCPDELIGSSVVQKWTAGERKTRQREEEELRRSALKGEKPGRKVPLKAVKLQISLRARDVIGARTKNALSMSF